MQLSQQLRRQPTHCRPQRSSRVRVVAQAVAAPQAPTAAAPAAAAANGSVSEIYIGFPKEGPREGKGRVIQDDPRKYPAKEDLGPLLGATGGWAGGEAGLWQLREQVLREKAAKKAAVAAVSSSSSSSSSSSAVKPPAPKGELQPVYVGYSKDELDQRKAGAPGRFVLDVPAKYPAKEDVGLFPGATGGFAGGEKGLRQFVETGEVKLRDPSQPPRGQTSPVAIAGLLIAAGAGGGLLLNEATDLGESAVKAEILNAPIDDKTKSLLLVAVALLGGVGLIAAGRALIGSLQERISEAGGQATKLVVAGAFWLGVFLVARTLLEL